MQVLHPSWVEIDLGQFEINLRTIKAYIGKSKFCLAVKANAYGHGLIPMAKAALKANIDYLAVAHLVEGIALREAGITIPILVLGAFQEDQSLELIQHGLEITISSLFKAKLIVAKCLEKNLRCKVHLEVDTGMQRTGVRPSSLQGIVDFLSGHDCVEIVGIYSHLATADQAQDPYALKQISDFLDLKRTLRYDGKKILWHICNSGGMVYYPQAHLDMVRVSLTSFGYMPSQGLIPKALESIQPCFSVFAKVSYFKVVEKGQGISYGHTYKTQNATRIVTIPVGYGDGYRRALSNRGHVLIHGKKYPIAGRICMDQFMVDIGEDEVHVGDLVTLIGKDGKEEIKLEEVAQLCDTIPYEILCGFNDRLPRVYISPIDDDEQSLLPS